MTNSEQSNSNIVQPASASANAAQRDPRIGTVVDKYHIVRLLGRGGMGSVYEGHHVLLERRFAIKFMLPEYAANRETLRRFENEAKAAGRLEHPNIAAVTDFGRASDDSLYLVMEYLAGQGCAELLKNQGPLPVQRAADIVYQVCMGLSVAHKAGIVHRDIKPENLFITEVGDSVDAVKILDFGIAKLRLPDASAVTGSGVAMGTYFYMAPEQVRDSGKVDCRADVWALGVVLYELLTGRKPFDGTDAAKIMFQIVFESPEPVTLIRPDVPAGIAAVIDAALKKEPDDRLTSVMAMADCLASFAGRTSKRAPVILTSGKPSALPTAFRATTSHASVAAMTNPPGHAATSGKAKALRLSVGALLVLALIAGAMVWLHWPKVAPVTASAAKPVNSNTSTEMAAASTTPPIPAAKPVDTSEESVTSRPASAAAVAESGARTKSEHSPSSSNKTRANPKTSDDTRRDTPNAAETSVQASQTKQNAPEKPKANTRSPLLIDTSSPY